MSHLGGGKEGVCEGTMSDKSRRKGTLRKIENESGKKSNIIV